MEHRLCQGAGLFSRMEYEKIVFQYTVFNECERFGKEMSI